MSGAASSNIAITLTAFDKTASTIDRFSARIKSITAPADRLSKSVSKLGDVTGVNRLGQSMQNLAGRSLDTFRSIDRISAPLAAITGAASIGGMTMLVQRWGELGQKVANAGQRLGIPTDRLTALQGAARLAGSNAEDLTAGLGALDEKLRGATFRGDGEAIQTFNKLGVNFGQIGVKARGAGDAFGDVADGIKKLYESGDAGRGAALRAAQNLGLESLFPLLLKGKAGIQELSAEAAKLGVVISPEAAKKAEALRKSFTEVGLAAEGLGNSIAEKLSEPVKKFNDILVKWIENNKDLISTDVAGWVTSFGNALNGLDKAKMGALLGAAIGYKIGGFKGALLGAGAGYLWANEGQPVGPNIDPSMGLAVPEAPAPYSIWKPWTWFSGSSGTDAPVPPQHPHPAISGSSAATEQQREHDFWRSKGLTETQVAGPLANVAAESGFDATKWNLDHTSYGLYQYTGSRLLALQKRYASQEPTADQQREFAWDELRGPEQATLLELRRAGSRSEAGRAFTHFERPAGMDQRAQERADAANLFAIPYPDAAAAAAPAGKVEGEVQVHVNLNGAPPGTTAKATTTGQVTASAPKVAMPMSGIAGDYSRGF